MMNKNITNCLVFNEKMEFYAKMCQTEVMLRMEMMKKVMKKNDGH